MSVAVKFPLGEKTMRAMVQISYGPPEVIVLQEITKPSLGSKELLVHFQAAKVGPSD